ncbi:chitin-binding domain protein cbd-1-like isoform X2 [Maniola jurtina]|uniref:chitin-binding domain protein cbd-1-like isoform X2 n=1 Tax=Maniola jurtina TaxID=191418 RepID=UPI001E68E686|nr:chitin-binding domain protein cbd-1-like isoform X2 [Maniola jurtina]
MKVAAILACAITVVFGSIIDLDLDVDLACTLNTVEKIFAHKYCDMYNECSNETIIERKCSKDFLFNIVTLECDWSYNVDCSGRNMSESNSEQTESPESDDENNDVSCNCDPAEAPEICARSGSNGVLVAHEDCTRLYKCSGGQPVTMRCPKSTFYNPYVKQCDWPENVDCSNRTIPEIEDDDNNGNDNNNDNDDDGVITDNHDTPDPWKMCAQNNTDGVLIPHEYCNWFYSCSGGQPISKACSRGLCWNPNKNHCDWPEKVDCGNKTISEPEPVDSDGNDNNDADEEASDNHDTPDPWKMCAQDDSDGALIPHEYCNWFYTCSSGQPIAKACSRDLCWNPNKNQCDWPGNVNCGNKTISEPEPVDSDGNDNNDADEEASDNHDTPDPWKMCAQDDSDGALIPHEYCNWFYTCSSGQPIAKACSRDLCWNPNKNQCDWPGNVNCGNKTISEPEPVDSDGNDNNDADEEASDNHDTPNPWKMCAQDDSDGALIPHEYCNWFYTCSSGQPIAKACSRDLCWNPNKNQCDWPGNVNCGNKTISEPEPVDSDGNDNNDADEEASDNHDTPDPWKMCAQDDSDGALIPHEYCNWFYTCSSGQPIAKACSRDLCWNPIKNQCDWPGNVNCGNKTISEPEPVDSDGNDNNDVDEEASDNHDTPDPWKMCAQDDSDGALIPHEYCNWFYTCSSGQPIAKACSRDLCWNPNKNQCDWPGNVNCGNKTISEPEPVDSDGNDNNDADEEASDNHDTPDPWKMCAQDDSDGALIPHEYCNWFYTCSSGQPIAKACSRDLCWNPNKNQCDWPGNVNCGNKTISEPEPVDSDGNDNNDADEEASDNHDTPDPWKMCAQDDSDGALIPHEYCNWFYTCSSGQPIAKACSRDLCWNPNKNQCDWPGNVNCGNKTISEPEPVDSDGNDNDDENDDGEIKGPIYDNPAEAATVCAQNNTNGVLVAHQNCDEFYICNLYAPVAMRCADGLHFNPYKGRCDWPENVDCGDRVIPERNNTQSEGDSEGSCKNCNPGEAPEICAREGSNGALIAHENCNQYYKCYAGVPNVLRCMNTLMFDPIKGWCDWPEQVDCAGRITSNDEDSGNDNPAKASEICARAGSDGVLVAHAMCNQFYKCSHGELMELECQSGLQYNPSMGLCDWPSNVDCGDRQQ